jgi:hypothetical protein
MLPARTEPKSNLRADRQHCGQAILELGAVIGVGPSTREIAEH